MKHKSQKEQLRQWLEQGHSITPIDALDLFGTLRLSALIFDLKKEGMPIKSERIEVEGGKRVARYTMESN